MAGSIGAVLAGISSSSRDTYSEEPPNYSAKLKLRTCKLSALGSIAGEVRLTVTYSTADLKGLWVQLITIPSCWPNGKEKRLGYKKSEVKLEQPYVAIFGSRTDAEDELDGDSPVRNSRSKSLLEGTHKFPFIFKLNDHQVPASFKSNYGEIQQRLLLISIQDHGRLYVLDDRPVMTTGCLNISKVLPDLGQPVEIVQRKTKSMFSSALRLQLTMELQRKGYLPAERIVGRVLIENPTGEVVEFMKIECIQRIIYFDAGLHKRLTSALDTNVMDCSDEQSEEAVIVKDFQLRLPPSLMPSWESPDKTFRLFYFVQSVIKTASGLEMKAESEVVIGTHDGRESVQSPRSPVLLTFPSLEHRNSDSQIELLRQSMESLPPSYSTLSSRRSSVATLPPPDYDSAVQE